MQPLSVKGVQVITNKSVNVKQITSAQLRRIYSMRQSRWPDNKPIVVFVLPSQHPLHKIFTQEKLKTFPYKLERIWSKLTFSGLGVAPKVVKNQVELLEAVRNTPGAVGYIENVSKDDGVHVVEISI